MLNEGFCIRWKEILISAVVSRGDNGLYSLDSFMLAHQVVSSSSLVMPNEPTLLSGGHPVLKRDFPPAFAPSVPPSLAI
jgi:hypothetical protein